MSIFLFLSIKKLAMDKESHLDPNLVTFLKPNYLETLT